MAFVPLPYFTVGGIVVAMIVGLFQIKESIKKRAIENQQLIDRKISSSVTEITKHFDEKFKTTDTMLNNSVDDIADIEADVKQMEQDFKGLCEKIGKHDYIVEKVLPEYMTLKDEFYKFKAKIDSNLFVKKASDTINNV